MIEAKDMVPVDESKGATVGLMLRELQDLNKVAVLKEDDNVIRDVIRGKSISEIQRGLQTKYPKENINRSDIEGFIVLYRDALHMAKDDVEKSYVRRILKSQEGLSNKLLDLATATEHLVEKCKDADDNTNAISAARTAADIFMKIGKVQGVFNDQPEINLNMKMDKVVNNVDGNDTEFKRSIMKLMAEKEVIDAEVVKDERREENV